MTNKEKHFDNASNEEIAIILRCLSDKCAYCVYGKDCKNPYDNYECLEGIKQWLSQEAEQTADEMFKELGYKICDGFLWKWVKLSDDDYHYVTYIWIYNDKFAKWDEKEGGNKNHRLITEDEDNAIHKKIEEIKKESKGD